VKRLRKKSGTQFHSNYPKRYRGINLTKEVKDLHNENCKTLKKEIEDDTTRWKDCLYS
jgi:hypothetical protein